MHRAMPDGWSTASSDRRRGGFKAGEHLTQCLLIRADKWVGAGGGRKHVEQLRADPDRRWEVRAEQHLSIKRPERADRFEIARCVDVVHPWTVDGSPEQLRATQLLGRHIARIDA